MPKRAHKYTLMNDVYYGTEPKIAKKIELFYSEMTVTIDKMYRTADFFLNFIRFGVALSL